MTNKNADMLRFVQQMIAIRKRHASIMRRRFLTGKIIESRGIKDISWHGAKLNTPLWDDSETRLLAFTLAGVEEDEPDLHVVINMSDEQTNIQLPVIKRKKWCLSVDTSQDSPNDIIRRPNQKPVTRKTFLVNKKTIVVFENINS